MQRPSFQHSHDTNIGLFGELRQVDGADFQDEALALHQDESHCNDLDLTLVSTMHHDQIGNTLATVGHITRGRRNDGSSPPDTESTNATMPGYDTQHLDLMP